MWSVVMNRRTINIIDASVMGAIVVAIICGVAYWWVTRATPESTAIAAVKAELKDPYSARFTDVHQNATLDSLVCGYVNSKNGFGAYTGRKPFTYSSLTDTVRLFPAADYDDFLAYCSQ